MIGVKNLFLDHPASVQLTRLWMCKLLIHFLTRMLLSLHVFSPLSTYGGGGHDGGEWLQPQKEGRPLRSEQAPRKNKTESLNDLEGQNPRSPLD